MPKSVVIEELHLSVLVPATLPETTVRKLRRIVRGRPLARRLTREMFEACRGVPLPKPIRVRVSK